jgi:hypothetical protein
MTNVDSVNTNTKTNRGWKRKACVIDLKSIRREEQRSMFRKRRMFLFGIALVSILAGSTLVANAESVRVGATVPGWYAVNQASNETLELTTNMTVYLNGELVKR